MNRHLAFGLIVGMTLWLSVTALFVYIYPERATDITVSSAIVSIFLMAIVLILEKVLRGLGILDELRKGNVQMLLDNPHAVFHQIRNGALKKDLVGNVELALKYARMERIMVSAKPYGTEERSNYVMSDEYSRTLCEAVTSTGSLEHIHQLWDTMTSARRRTEWTRLCWENIVRKVIVKIERSLTGQDYDFEWTLETRELIARMYIAFNTGWNEIATFMANRGFITELQDICDDVSIVIPQPMLELSRDNFAQRKVDYRPLDRIKTLEDLRDWKELAKLAKRMHGMPEQGRCMVVLNGNHQLHLLNDESNTPARSPSEAT